MNHSHVSCCVDRSPYTVLCFDWSDKIFPLWSSYWFSLSRIPLPVKWWGSVEEWPWKRAWLWVFYGRKRAKIDFFIIVWGVFFPKKKIREQQLDSENANRSAQLQTFFRENSCIYHPVSQQVILNPTTPHFLVRFSSSSDTMVQQNFHTSRTATHHFSVQQPHTISQYNIHTPFPSRSAHTISQ